LKTGEFNQEGQKMAISAEFPQEAIGVWLFKPWHGTKQATLEDSV